MSWERVRYGNELVGINIPGKQKSIASICRSPIKLTHMKLEAIEKNAVLRLSLDFSVALIDYCEKLGSQYKFVIAKQLLRSGTSIGANAMEAQDGESKRDFIHKMKVAAKEASETQYWLLICERAGSYPNPAPLQSTLIEINRLLNSIIATSKRKNPFSYFLTLFM